VGGPDGKIFHKKYFKKIFHKKIFKKILFKETPGLVF